MKIRLLCRLGFHRFGPWGRKFSHPGYVAPEYQNRTCQCCGYVHQRTI